MVELTAFANSHGVSIIPGVYIYIWGGGGTWLHSGHVCKFVLFHLPLLLFHLGLLPDIKIDTPAYVNRLAVGTN